jgi:penicillin-binding protein 2
MPAFNQSRQNFIRILFLLAFFVLVLRLLFLQLGSKKYDLLALDNAVSKKIIYPDRGIIFDRKGKSILENTLT